MLTGHGEDLFDVLRSHVFDDVDGSRTDLSCPGCSDDVLPGPGGLGHDVAFNQAIVIYSNQLCWLSDSDQ